MSFKDIKGMLDFERFKYQNHLTYSKPWGSNDLISLNNTTSKTFVIDRVLYGFDGNMKFPQYNVDLKNLRGSKWY